MIELDGVWDFFPGDHELAALEDLRPEPIQVPGLWEAQGWLDLDGVAWYRRHFDLADTSGHWTLRFGGVMDRAEVHLNGVALGDHDQPYTPFEVDPTPALRAGKNVLAVRVVDPPLSDPDHTRMAHGKQGWANHVFPSPPSLYMTYGGIWQPVTLRRHGPVAIVFVFVNGDPDDLVVTVRLQNRSGAPQTVRAGVRAVGKAAGAAAELAPGALAQMDIRLGATGADRWSPEDPTLQVAGIDVAAGGHPSDTREVRFGLRTVGLAGRRLLVNGAPYRMKSALVQGFTADRLYAEGTRAQIVDEVTAARNMGFNTLRLHIKAFDPTYLDVCDELGMLLHCDIPVAEPLAHAEMGGDTLLTRRCVAAAREQVRRDRNHPSVILWSAMNEVGEGRWESRQWPGYEAFARTMYDAVTSEDPTRPVIENDWIEPDPGRVFVSPILTAHWYGRLHREYIEWIEAASTEWAGDERPLFVTEYGDWGIPDMPVLSSAPFWDPREVYAATVTAAGWPGPLGGFIAGTQRYQGVSDRLQTEVFRRHDHLGGYCLTELTDVPQEYNGLLDLHRRPKRLAAAVMTRANQVVLPMLALDSLVVVAGGTVHAELHVANDGPALAEVVLQAGFGEMVVEVELGDVPGWTVAAYPAVCVGAPDVAGGHDLVLRLRSGDGPVAENRYPIHVVAPAPAPAPAGRPMVVAEGALDAAAGAEARARLDRGEVVVILAQPIEAAAHYPVPVTLEALTSVWGSTVFRFTTDHGAVPSLPRRAVLVAEDATVQPACVVSGIDGDAFPDTPVVIAYKPVPGAMTGTVLGSHAVGAGRLVFCQYRLRAGDAAAEAVLADVLRWAAVPRSVMRRQESVKDDGRALLAYSWRDGVAR